MVLDFISGLTDEQKLFLTSNEYELTRYSKLDKSKLDDPDLVDVIDAGGKRDDIVKFQKIWEDLCSMSWDLNINNMHSMFTTNARAEWIEKRYPLVQILMRPPYNAGQTYWDHVYMYLNEAYRVFKNKGV
jgi:hypothetical protein